ncbi:MAG: PaaI family thioesterase [Pseudomonadota bacterium]
MSKLNPLWIEATKTSVNACPYFKLQSMSIIDMGGGLSRLEIEIQEKHLQPFGVVHGGVFSSLVDAAGFWAVYPEIPGNLGLTTVEMKLNYLAPAAAGRLIGLGKTIKTGRTISLAETRIENEQGRLLAHGTVTLMSLSGQVMAGSGEIPAKFLP